MPTSESIHYVKFLRGLQSAWERLLQTPGNIDNDTLYFIYENAENSTEGKLYLGQKLIGGTGTSGTVNIEDIGGIYIDDEKLENKQLLVYNSETQSWMNAPLSEIINESSSDIVDIINSTVTEMVGASAAADGTSGLVPVPRIGDQSKFLRGDGSWATINVPTFNTEVFSISNNEVSLRNYDIATVGSVPIKTNDGVSWTSLPTGRLNREIVTLEELQARLNGTSENPISEDTIYMVLNGNDDSSSDKYDEYMIINNRIERLGTFGQVDLTNYVQVTTFNTEVKKLEDTLYDQQDEETGEEIPGLVSRVNRIEIAQTQFSNKVGNLNELLLSEGNTTLVEEVNSINERLKWQELN